MRALHPHVGARLELEHDVTIGVLRAALASDTGACAGRARASSEGRLLLGCDPGVLELLEVQPPGGRAMDAAAYLRGHRAPRR